MLWYVFNFQLPSSLSIGSIVFCFQICGLVSNICVQILFSICFVFKYGQKNLTGEKKKVAAGKINIIRNKNLSDEKNIANW